MKLRIYHSKVAKTESLWYLDGIYGALFESYLAWKKNFLALRRDHKRVNLLIWDALKPLKFDNSEANLMF